MGVDGDIWYILSSADRFGTDASIGYSGTISIVDLGPLSTGLRFQLLGNVSDYGTLVRLYADQLERSLE